MGVSSSEETHYSVPLLARLLHSLPHVNVTFHYVNSTFEPENPVYLESLGILGSIPAAWLILTLLVLLVYLVTRCCDRAPRAAHSILALKATLAIVSVICCAAIGVGLYGNDDLHNGLNTTLYSGKQVDFYVSKIRNQTRDIERQLRIQADRQIRDIRNVLQIPVADQKTFKEVEEHFKKLVEYRNTSANAAVDIRQPLVAFNLTSTIRMNERIESIRWPLTMGILSVLLILCVILLVGVARHNRCALIAFSVCGLLAVITSYLMASVYLATSVALGDFCMTPEKFIENQASSELSKEIIKYYIVCEKARANPFTQRLRESKDAADNMLASVKAMEKPAEHLYPDKGLANKFTSLRNDIMAAENYISALTGSVDCTQIRKYYVQGATGLCNVGLLGLTLMLASAVLAGFLLTILVWVDSHTWIYIGKKKDYHQVNEHDPYLPPPQASQAIAARTLQRSQGSSYPPDTPPPSYSSILLHKHANAPPAHEADFLL